jgi:16S rRNA (uracil1498-N3)-methyltransferase
MGIKSVYLPDPSFENEIVRIGGDEHRHLVVARAETDEPVEIFDGKGNVWTATIVSLGKRETLARMKENRCVERDAVDLILAQALIKSSAFELALEKTVEVGVTRIAPFVASRSNVSAAGRQDRWLRIVVEAAKQSKRYYLPALDTPVTFEEVLSIQASSKILFAERGGGPLKSALSGWPVIYAIGPEGGWTDHELVSARDHGFGLVSLGSGILKAETAAIVGAALIRYELGL